MSSPEAPLTAPQEWQSQPLGRDAWGPFEERLLDAESLVGAAVVSFEDQASTHLATRPAVERFSVVSQGVLLPVADHPSTTLVAATHRVTEVTKRLYRLAMLEMPRYGDDALLTEGSFPTPQQLLDWQFQIILGRQTQGEYAVHPLGAGFMEVTRADGPTADEKAPNFSLTLGYLDILRGIKYWGEIPRSKIHEAREAAAQAGRRVTKLGGAPIIVDTGDLI